MEKMPWVDDQELYRKFLEFTSKYQQKDRALDNRRMLNVFLWCFAAPAIVSITSLLLINYGVLPRSFRSYLDWVSLVFPVLYTVYFLWSQVLTGLPMAFKKGGFSMNLTQIQKEFDWRNQMIENLVREFKINQNQWQWLEDNLSEDLDRMQTKTRYLTVLAGAVFYLLMQGIDSVTSEPMDQTVAMAARGLNASGEWIGLMLFLILLYFSGNHSYHLLKRYVFCLQQAKKHQSG